MELFKKLMGVPAGKYDVFRDFKRRVLDKAVNEVNTYSDLVIESDFVREGRKVTKVRFKLKERAKKTRLGPHSKSASLSNVTESEQLPLKLSETFGLSPEQIEQLLSEYEAQYISDKVAIIEESKPFKEGKVENLPAYLFSAIKNNFQAPKKKTSQVVNIQEAKQALEMNDIVKHVTQIRHHYQLYREDAIHEVIDGLHGDEKQLFIEKFLQHAEPVVNTVLTLQHHTYSRDNLFESPQIKASLRQFALRELDILSLLSLEEYILQMDESKRDVWQKLKSLDPDHPLLRYSD
jgi:plasmid replication initiation protein